jgi:RNA polymerase sigma-70 factor (ECF subfamily)
MSKRPDDGFPTTQWSLVVAAGKLTGAEARSALTEICQAYWYPVYAQIRRSVGDPDFARDLTQEFFADLLEKGSLATADPDRGRFRHFLNVLIKRHLSHQRRRERTLKRGGGMSMIELDFDSAESSYRYELAQRQTPETLFEQVWARTLLARAMERLRRETAGTTSEERFKLFEPYLTGQEVRTPYKEAAEKLGMSEAAVKTAVHRLRKRFGELLRAEVRNTVVDPAIVEEEIRHLISVIGS